MESYAVRELFFALLFFAIFYVLLAAIAMLYILFIDGLDHGSTWIAVLGRALVFLLRQHFAFSSRVVDVSKHMPLHLVRKGKAARRGIH
jgi:phosphoglycerol transferase MdoB-like AlkP superfamily enzyme